jgi:hypothetical protein
MPPEEIDLMKELVKSLKSKAAKAGDPMPSKHTPEAYELNRYGCGCRIVSEFLHRAGGIMVVWCPMHTAAPDLLEACKSATAVFESIGFEDKRAIRQTLRAAIRKAEGE